VAELPDHDDLLIGGEWNDVDPIVRFNNVKIMLGAGPGRDGSIRPNGEDTKGLGDIRPDMSPGFDHLFLL